MIFDKIFYLFILSYILIDVGSLPEHEFIGDVKRKTNANNTVDTKTTITLHQGPYKFSRTKTRKNVAYFNCRNKKKGCKATGIASLTGDPNDVDEYILDDISTNHTCQDSTVDRKKINL